MAEKDIIAEAQEAFKAASEYESENRSLALEDARFVWLAEQWPAEIRQQRERDKRPCLTINKLPSFVRQVVNDARQNKPQITVSPVDSESDPKTAEIISGMIRHIERNSGADIAYDTAVEWAVSTGLGYITVGVDYAGDSGFEQEIIINRVVSPFSIYGDPDSEAADSADWNCAFQVITTNEDAVERQYDAKSRDVQSWSEAGLGDEIDDKEGALRLVRYWKVTPEKRTLVQLSNGAAKFADEITEDDVMLWQAAGVVPTDRTREVRVNRVKYYVLSGNGILDEGSWVGRYIPIVPVYGTEFFIDGKRHWKSLIRDAIDAQRMLNFWRTASTELVALAPKAPFIGPKGAFRTDVAKWKTANTQNHPFIEYDGDIPPQRQGFVGPPAGALQEALNASDDIKAITGIYDPSLGAKSNETSGRAILARQRESDVANYHFIDNLVRAIRHVGRICLDLVPKVYDTPRIVRVLGLDGKAEQVQVNAPFPEQDAAGAAIEKLYDLTVGRYDVHVSAGPSYSTQRQEAAAQMVELIKAMPQAAPLISDLIAKNLDWPGAEDIANRLRVMLPPQIQQAEAAKAQSPEAQAAMMQAQAAMQQVQQMGQQLQQAAAEVEKEQAKVDKSKADLQVQAAKLEADYHRMIADITKRESAIEVRLSQAQTDAERAAIQTEGQQVRMEAQAAVQAMQKQADEFMRRAYQILTEGGQPAG